MGTASDQDLLQLLQACADATPLYPARYAKEKNLDRARLDEGLDELRRRGLIQLTDWVKDFGQGRALTDAGAKALVSGRLTRVPPAAAPPSSERRILAYERGEMARDAVYDDATIPYVSRTLIAVNVFIFLFGAFVAWINDLDVQDYLAGVNGRQDTTSIVLDRLGDLNYVRVFPPFPGRRPQFERIVLFFFLHVGVFHLGINMFFLATLGGLLEGMWGRLRFLTIYLIAGVVSGSVILWLNAWTGWITPTAGASGSLCGAFVSMLVWFYLNREHLPEQLLQSWSRVLTINALLLIATSMAPGISWQGHLGGAIGGFLAAALMYLQRFHPSFGVRVLALLGLPFIPAAFFTLALWQADWL